MARLGLDSHSVDDHRLELVVSVDGEQHVLSFAADRPITPSVGDVLLTTLLVPAIACGSDLSIPAPVSPDLLANTAALQTVFASWLEVQPVIVDATATRTAGHKPASVASFFSGGVDSFYTVLRHIDEIDTLIFLRGFEIPASKPRLAATVSDRMRSIAAELGKDLIEVDIEGRAFIDHLVDWNLYFGMLLISTAHLLAGHVGTVLLPASLGLRDLAPCGSHPLTDPLWSSSSVEIVHDGVETDRAEKIQYIAESEIAMRNLRVCWENPNEEYNCGRCRKCLMTMAGLHAVGALGRCASLPDTVDADALEAILILNDLTLALARYYLAALERADDPDPRLITALRRMIGDYRRRQAEAYLGPLVPGGAASPSSGHQLIERMRIRLARVPAVRSVVRWARRRIRRDPHAGM